jgi:hypothetical protein
MGLHVRSYVALAGLAVAACGGEKAAKASGAYGDEVSRAVPKIEKSVGLTFKKPPALEVKSRDEMASYIKGKLAEELEGERIKSIERVYKRFGLLTESFNLMETMTALLSEQVIGLYDPKTKVLYVVSGASGDQVYLTIAHELVHALQDQYFNLDSLMQAKDDNDRTTAGQSAIEGQATFEMFAVVLGSENAIARLPGGWDRVRQMIREQQGSMPVFAAAPVILQETLIFPYLSGAEFSRRFKEESPGKNMYDRMPVSTEQVMHADRYFVETPDAPTDITLPAPSIGKSVYENNLGEFETRILLYEYLNDQSAAVRGAAGWDGDRYQLIDTGRGEALVWISVWDTAIDAADFFSSLDIGYSKRFPATQPLTSTQQMRTYRSGNRIVSFANAEVRGRPVVIFSDVPDGVRPDLIDLSKVTLKE